MDVPTITLFVSNTLNCHSKDKFSQFFEITRISTNYKYYHNYEQSYLISISNTDDNKENKFIFAPLQIC